MSTTRTKMVQDLELAGYAVKTRKTYLECIGLFAQFCWSPAESPDRYQPERRGRPRSRRRRTGIIRPRHSGAVDSLRALPPQGDVHGH